LTDHHIDQFNSLRLGSLNLDQVIDEVVDFIRREDNSHFKITVGTDSELVGPRQAHFVSAIVVHHVGHGAIYFWSSLSKENIATLRQRIYEEATYSLVLAQDLLEKFKDKDLPLEKLLEIHVDVGEVGETRTLINEVVGMIKGSGFVCQTKPLAFAASNVADRHT